MTITYSRLIFCAGHGDSSDIASKVLIYVLDRIWSSLSIVVWSILRRMLIWIYCRKLINSCTWIEGYQGLARIISTRFCTYPEGTHPQNWSALLLFHKKISNVPIFISDGKSWAPHIAYVFMLSFCWFMSVNKGIIPFGISIALRKPTNHLDECYFCNIVPVISNIEPPCKNVNAQWVCHAKLSWKIYWRLCCKKLFMMQSSAIIMYWYFAGR